MGTIAILIGLLIIVDVIMLIAFFNNNKTVVTKNEILSAIQEVKNSERTKMENFVVKSIFVGGIHALFINKGIAVSYKEVEQLFNELESQNEVIFELTKKYYNKK